MHPMYLSLQYIEYKGMVFIFPIIFLIGLVLIVLWEHKSSITWLMQNEVKGVVVKQQIQ